MQTNTIIPESQYKQVPHFISCILSVLQQRHIIIFKTVMNYTKEYCCKLFVYIILLALGLLMTKSSINHYQEGKTYFATYQTTISVVDLPVVTICFENYDVVFSSNDCQPRLDEPISIHSIWDFGDNSEESMDIR